MYPVVKHNARYFLMSWTNPPIPIPSFDDLRKMNKSQLFVLFVTAMILLLVIIASNHHLLVWVACVLLWLTLCGCYVNKNEEQAQREQERRQGEEEQERREKEQAQREQKQKQKQQSMDLKEHCAPELRNAISKYKEFYKRFGYYPDHINKDEMKGLLRAIAHTFRICEIELDEEDYKTALIAPFVLANKLLPYAENGDVCEVRRALNTFLLSLRSDT